MLLNDSSWSGQDAERVGGMFSSEVGDLSGHNESSHPFFAPPQLAHLLSSGPATGNTGDCGCPLRPGP